MTERPLSAKVPFFFPRRVCCSPKILSPLPLPALPAPSQKKKPQKTGEKGEKNEEGEGEKMRRKGGKGRFCFVSSGESRGCDCSVASGISCRSMIKKNVHFQSSNRHRFLIAAPASSRGGERFGSSFIIYDLWMIYFGFIN